VMGSKNLKDIVFRGSLEPEVAEKETLRRLAADAYREIKRKPAYAFWMR